MGAKGLNSRVLVLLVAVLCLSVGASVAVDAAGAAAPASAAKKKKKKKKCVKVKAKGKKGKKGKKRKVCKPARPAPVVPPVQVTPPAGGATNPGPPDGDGDGAPDATDNCAGMSNPSQSDGDNDGKGDECDSCPNTANPGTQGCPVKIFRIADGTLPVGYEGRLTDVMVTAFDAGGSTAVVQEQPGEVPENPGLLENSAIALQVSSVQPITLHPGDRITVDGTVVSSGRRTLHVDELSVDSTGGAPAAAPMTPSTLAALPSNLNATLVTVTGAFNLDAVSTTPGPFGNYWTVSDGAAHSFTLQGEFFGGPLPACAVGTDFTGLTGVAQSFAGVSGIYPRDAADIAGANPAC